MNSGNKNAEIEQNDDPDNRTKNLLDDEKNQEIRLIGIIPKERNYKKSGTYGNEDDEENEKWEPL